MSNSTQCQHPEAGSTAVIYHRVSLKSLTVDIAQYSVVVAKNGS
jgi:hypothetical protein